MRQGGESEPLRRTLGEYSGAAPGPLLLVVGGLHGNEPAGIRAARRVLDTLAETRPPLRGKFVALAGNLQAQAEGRRYLERDLNRAWWEEDLARLRSSKAGEIPGELGELRELLVTIEAHLGDASEGAILLDLHSSSADGPPFTITADTLPNRRIAFALGLPVILGLEELIQGSVFAHLGEKGHAALCVEGGRSDAPSTLAHLEAAVWLAMAGAGMLRPEHAPVEIEGMRERLAECVRGLPGLLKVHYRHGLRADDDFRMEPGYVSFQPVAEGELLARSGPDGTSPVRAPREGRLLLPRYQGQGDDGFFLGREIPPL